MIFKRLLAGALALALTFAPALANQATLYSPTTGTVSGLNLTNNYNAAIDSLASCNSGSSAPANTLTASPDQGMCWLNTSSTMNKVEIYDGTQWEIVAYLDTVNHLYIPIVGGGSGTLAAATTTDLGSVPQSYLSITGSATITSLGSSAPIGSTKFLTFAAGSVLTYNGSTLILPTAANITTAAGDYAIAVSTASGSWKLAYFPASGQPLALPTGLVTPWSITGGLPSGMTGTNTTAAMTISATAAADQTDALYIGWTGSKSWSVTNGTAINGSADGSTLTASSTYHMYDCHGTSGDGSFASRTAPGTFLPANCPSGYQTYARRLFSFTTSGAGAPNPYTAVETMGGAVQAWLATPALDIAGLTPTTTRSLYALSTPVGVKTGWAGRFSPAGASSGSCNLVSPDEPDLAPSPTTNAGADVSAGGVELAFHMPITDASAHLGVRCTAAASSMNLSTAGWLDFRRN